MTYYVYLLECSDGSYYCGYTTNLEKRVAEHNDSKKGAKYTYAKRPVTLKYHESFSTLSQALKREHQIKKLSHIEKSGIIK